jgi:hypothetical protein
MSKTTLAPLEVDGDLGELTGVGRVDFDGQARSALPVVETELDQVKDPASDKGGTSFDAAPGGVEGVFDGKTSASELEHSPSALKAGTLFDAHPGEGGVFDGPITAALPVGRSAVIKSPGSPP